MESAHLLLSRINHPSRPMVTSSEPTLEFLQCEGAENPNKLLTESERETSGEMTACTGKRGVDFTLHWAGYTPPPTGPFGRRGPSWVYHARNGSWSGLGDGVACATAPSCEVCLNSLKMYWSGLLDGAVRAWGGPSDRPVGGGVSAPLWGGG